MTSTVEFGEVYVCVFPFTSRQGAKARPVLVLMDLAGEGTLLTTLTYLRCADGDAHSLLTS